MSDKMKTNQWEPGKYFVLDMIKDKKFTYIAKSCIEQSLIPPSEDFENWSKYAKNPSAVVEELEVMIKDWKLHGKNKEVIEKLEGALYL